MSFKVGQKVVCIKEFDNVWVESGQKDNGCIPKLNEVYEIEYINNIGNLGLKECPEIVFFVSYKFRPLDYDFVEEVISNLKDEPVLI